MRHGTALRLLAACALTMTLSAPAVAVAEETEPLTAAEVVGLPTDYDGRTVLLEGEAIGDVLGADLGHKWVNVLSGGIAVGVWVDAEAAQQVGLLGDYQTEGDTVRTEGTFNVACDQHGGDLDVHADSFTVVSPGRPVARPLRLWKVAVAVVLGAIAIVQTALYRAGKRRRLTT